MTRFARGDVVMWREAFEVFADVVASESNGKITTARGQTVDSSRLTLMCDRDQQRPLLVAIDLRRGCHRLTQAWV